VERVSWEDAQAFCRSLSERPEERAACRVYRLPTEAEWEYACRAGGAGRFGFGDDEATTLDHAWVEGNSAATTHPVGQKRPNAWGLYDMHGNVWEWCGDWYEPGYYRQSPADNPRGPAAGSARVVRGGSFVNTAGTCRSGTRNFLEPTFQESNGIGFRVVCEVAGTSAGGFP
jgi:formylglycine-generating enzyme required for sulfatase activity